MSNRLLERAKPFSFPGGRLGSFMFLYTITSLAWAAVDSSRLWLPQNYLKEYIKLKQAAELVEGTRRCNELVQGGLHLDRSKLDHPVFKLICRDQYGKTYAEVVDGHTMKLIELDRPKTPEQLAEENKSDMEYMVDRAWSLCDEHLGTRTEGFIERQWLTEGMPEAQLGEGEQDTISFVLDFNAKDIQGNSLKYRAQCVYEPEEDKVNTNIRPRR